jgi:hypothetical protein
MLLNKLTKRNQKLALVKTYFTLTTLAIHTCYHAMSQLELLALHPNTMSTKFQLHFGASWSMEHLNLVGMMLGECQDDNNDN